MFKSKEELRKKSMKTQVNPYLQTTDLTCVASSYLMALNKLIPDAFKLDSETEMGLHDKIKFWEGGNGEYGSYPKLARHALNLGLNVNMALYGLKKPEFMTKDLWDKYMDNFLPILDSLKNHERFHLEERDFNVLDLINEVENGKIPLVEIKYPTAECTHHVIVRGFTGNKIKIVNPLNGFESYNIDDFEEKINIGYMKNFISLSKPEGLEVKLISAGLSASKGDSRGLCQVIDKYDENFAEGRILVASRTDPDMTPNMISSSGIITDQGGILCHAAIVSRELGIPCVVGTEKSTSLLETGDFVYLDADSGRIYLLK